jgi:effector-binding domain-containing protein
MANPTPQLVEVDEQPTAVVRGRVPMAELPGFFDRSFGTLAGTLAEQGVEIVGPAFARYSGPPGEIADLEVGFPVAGAVEASGDVEPGTLPGGTVARVVHPGAYEDLGAAWGALSEWMAAEGHSPGPALWETYLTEPTPDTDPADLRTELTWTVA